MMLNRKQAPAFKNIEKINFLKPTKHLLKNKIPIYLIDKSPEDLVKIDFIFNSGIFYQDMPLVSTITNSLMSEGTKKMSSAEIAEKIDFCGAYIEKEIRRNTASLNLITLNKYLPKVLPIMEDILKNAIYPEKDFLNYINKRKQNFLIDQKKVEKLADTKFAQVIFGENHPYGKTASLEDFDHPDLLENIKIFYKKFYTAKNCQIVVAGKIPSDFLNLMNEHFGGEDWNNEFNLPERNFKVFIDPNKKHFIEKKDALQSSIRIGLPLFSKIHPDHQAMQIVNMILGGYFGSRLMSNIREEKGYTYGIYSYLSSQKDIGYLAINTEVGKDVCQQTIEEIYKEIDLLKTELISEEELKLVKNYTFGEMLRGFDGAFANANAFKSLLYYNLDYDYFENFINLLKNITPKQILDLSNKYFDKNKFKEIVAGDK